MCGRRFRQLFVLDLEHDNPTILLTNQGVSGIDTVPLKFSSLLPISLSSERRLAAL